jgi:thioredoxin-related protein
MSVIRLFSMFVLSIVVAGCASNADNKPRIYDKKADGRKQFDVALKQAQAADKRLLLNLGANWCGDSQAMYRLLTTNSEIQRVIGERYVLTLVDVNKRRLRDRNRALLERIDNPVERIPVLLIVDQSGKIQNTDPAERLLDSDHQHPDRVLAYLRKWAGK